MLGHRRRGDFERSLLNDPRILPVDEVFTEDNNFLDFENEPDLDTSALIEDYRRKSAATLEDTIDPIPTAARFKSYDREAEDSILHDPSGRIDPHKLDRNFYRRPQQRIDRSWDDFPPAVPKAPMTPVSLPSAADKFGAGISRFDIPHVQQQNDRIYLSSDPIATVQQKPRHYTEREHLESVERDYKEQLARLQERLEEVLRQHRHVQTLKEQSETALQRDLQQTKLELAALRRRLSDDDDTEDVLDADGNLRNSFSLFPKESRRIIALKKRHQEEIRELSVQFQREKMQAIKEYKARIRSELATLVPRLREQALEAVQEQLASARESADRDARQKYEQIILALKEEHRLDKQATVRSLVQRFEAERTAFKERMAEQFQVRLMQVKNECERRILDRLSRK